jgi:hypothetical protein
MSSRKDRICTYFDGFRESDKECRGPSCNCASRFLGMTAVAVSASGHVVDAPQEPN